MPPQVKTTPQASV